MNHTLQQLANTRQTYRNMLNLYWLTILLTAAFEYALHDNEAPQMFLAPLVLQAFGLAAVTGVAEMLYRYRKMQSDYLLIFTGMIYASSIILMNPSIGIVPAIYIFPILTSVLSFNRKKIVAAFIMILLSFGLLYTASPELREAMHPIHIIGLLFLYIGVTVIAFTISSSGIELLNNLNLTTVAKQELLVKNIIMDKLSKIDALTDLYNHKTFHEYIEKLIEQCEDNKLSMQLAIIDIDNFKTINDTYGHWVGDVILTRVAGILKDTVTPNDFVARYGGEEFAVIFTEKSLDEAYRIAEQIRHQLAITLHPELDSQAATISIGLQDYVKGIGKERLFKGADSSLYTAKRTGKNKTVAQTAGSGELGVYSI
ncbi:GGDEF domain-containing protein [Paenibacillus cremeus]|uniref:GGDEF domain-containing protein n=1 Tax=Paenibacillus cremeus TaxID=2163881 RepID=A0A559KC95_9BACL|nr:GGDEF domain-containing protein [Paenibacillus cremeus]TVY09756.1 GGDEF domain-containing protein [Paenibacillus cremeus]